MKYIVIDTWNGGGMDSYNGENISVFECEQKASIEASRLAESEITDKDFEDGEERLYTGPDGTILRSYIYNLKHGQGTYQVHELSDDIYAVNIVCNINEVMLLTKTKYDDLLKHLCNEAEENDGFLGDYHDGNKFIDDGQYYNKLIILKNIR